MCTAEVKIKNFNTYTSIQVSPPAKSASCGVQVSMRPASVTVAVQHRGRGRSKGVQVNSKSVMTVTVGTQTKGGAVTGEDNDFRDDESMSSERSAEVMDSGSEYQPSDEETDKEMDEEPCSSRSAEQEPCSSPPKHGVFLTFWACLVELIATWCSCPSCGCRKLAYKCKEVGTLLKVTLTCTADDCGHTGTWKSQPFYGKTAAGNILLSAAILFSGATVTKVLRVLSHMGVAVTCVRSFFRHQDNM
ncbi:uncharacterized protein LOC118425254 [Branchiostoma floridae]|uniref:Uncharacterized protein LOC118425254 n=1 Tax=Branchiostoma floridae TaxID=7739 RepID=A0A9J7LVL1_BRAFL|nr:uncharacterized protein LOC118425254 [Branchiostoma floridae]